MNSIKISPKIFVFVSKIKVIDDFYTKVSNARNYEILKGSIIRNKNLTLNLKKGNNK